MEKWPALASLLWALAPSVGNAQNALSTVAASLAPGTWQELSTNNIGALNQNGTDGNIIPYAGDAAWDPNSRKLLYVGNDHIDSIQSEADRFVIYSADTNSWRNMPPPPWSSAGITDHGYYEHGIDASKGIMYRRQGKSGTAFGKFDIASETWSTTAADTGGLAVSSACCSGVDFFPELGGLVHAQGGEPGGGVLRFLDANTNQWSGLAQNLTLMNGGTYSFAAYNAVKKVMIFGSEDGAYKITQSKTVSQIATPPFAMYDGTGYLATIVADPVSGEYVALSSSSRQLYTYNVDTNAWQTKSSTNKPSLGNHSIIAAAIPNYGVILFVSCSATNCNVYVYKHAPGGGGTAQVTPAAPTGLAAL